ncbi:hypothetical protein [Alteromonas sp. M12]
MESNWLSADAFYLQCVEAALKQIWAITHAALGLFQYAFMLSSL